MSEDTIEGVQLTRIEQKHAFAPDKPTSKEITIALAEKIATDPPLYNSVRQNPYSEEAQQIMSNQFPNINSAFYARSIVLSEREAAYDKEYHEASLDQKQEMLYEQIDTSAEASVRLYQYFESNQDTFWDKNPEAIFKELSGVLFETDDYDKAGEKYALNQRRGFRLAITNFIEKLPMLKEYKNKSVENPKDTIQNIFGKTIEGEVAIKVTPLGLVVDLDEDDFGMLTGDITGHGQVLVTDPAPPELRSSITIINRGGEKTGIPSDELIEITKKHEMKHIVYDTFFEPTAPHRELSITEDDKVAEFWKKTFLDLAKNESLAYIANENYYPNAKQIHLHEWHNHLNELREKLESNDELPASEKQQIYLIYKNKFSQARKGIQTYQWLQRELYIASDKDENNLTPEKVEALLRITPVDRARRLGKYIGIDPKDIPARADEELKRMEQYFTKRVNALLEKRRTIIDGNSEQEAGIIADAYLLQDFTYDFPVEAVPGLLKLVTSTEDLNLQQAGYLYLEGIIQDEGMTLDDDILNTVRNTVAENVDRYSDEAHEVVNLRGKNILTLIDQQKVNFLDVAA